MAYKVRSEVLQTRVTADDKAAIERAADKAGMTVSEYLRACALTVMATSFDRHAINVMARGVSSALADFRASLREQRKQTA